MKQFLAMLAVAVVGLPTAGCVVVTHHDKEKYGHDDAYCHAHPHECEGWCRDHPDRCTPSS